MEPAAIKVGAGAVGLGAEVVRKGHQYVHESVVGGWGWRAEPASGSAGTGWCRQAACSMCPCLHCGCLDASIHASYFLRTLLHPRLLQVIKDPGAGEMDRQQLLREVAILKSCRYVGVGLCCKAGRPVGRPSLRPALPCHARLPTFLRCTPAHLACHT